MRTGTVVKFSLTHSSLIQFKVYRATRGRLQGRRCVAAARGRTRARPCVRYVPLRGSFDVAGTAGTNRFRFLGRLGGRALALGGYKLVATSVGADGRSGAPIGALFKIVG